MGTFSKEFCGGTHVENTADIGIFNIVSESSLSSGVRRIEAIAAQAAVERLNDRSNILKAVEGLLKTNPTKIEGRIEQLLNEIKDKTKEIKTLKEKVQSTEGQKLFEDLEDLSNGFVFKAAETDSGSDLRKISDGFINKFPKGIVLLYCENKGKLSALLRTNSKNKEIDCSKVLKEALESINGRGGGRADMSQGSGDLIKDTKPFVNKIKTSLSE
jgi:alanyl-tRNA synthetase